MIHIGIDPGLSGAIATIQGTTYTVVDMPILSSESKKGKKVKTKNYLDRVGLLELLDDLTQGLEDGEILIAIERQGPRPNQGVMGTFNAGVIYGGTLGVLDALGIPYFELNPQEWQRHFHIGKDTKGEAAIVASKLFPDAPIRGPRGGLLDGRSDALLICEFARRKYSGEVEKW